jgi:hypothetical protein
VLRRRDATLVVASLGLVALVGAASLARPFAGDQALFVVGGRQLTHGARMYGDFWDIKQPAIYWFYGLAGRAFGSHEVGIHLAELIWQLALAVVAVLVLRPRLREPRLLALAPLVTVGLYYATAQTIELTQLESLVGLPALLALWCAVGAGRPGQRWLRLAGCGLAAGVVLTFKFVFLPVAGVFAVVALWQTRRVDRRPVALASAAALLLAGAAVPLGLLVLRTWRDGQLGFAAHTWFTVPRHITALPGVRTRARLFSESRPYALRWAPLLVLAVPAVLRRRSDPLVVGLVGWVAAGVVVVLLQLWWIYLWAALIVPVGLLGVLGADVALERWRAADDQRRLRPLAVGLGLLAILPVAVSVERQRPLARDRFGATATGRRHLRDQAYGPARADVASLRGDPRAGPMYVLGDPTIMYLTERDQAVATNGWSPELFLPEQCRDLAHELAVARPEHVFINAGALATVRERCPDGPDPLPPRYVPAGRSARGVWYRALP